MKGWPLLRAVLTLVVLLLAGLPLRSLTRPREVANPVEIDAKATEKIEVRVTFTQPPTQFSVKFLGREILTSGEEPSFEAVTTLDAHFPMEGIDLVFEGTWPEYFRKVGASIQITRANGVQQSQTLWGKRKLFELLTFTGQEGS